jgi:hypothetical protein
VNNNLQIALQRMLSFKNTSVSSWNVKSVDITYNHTQLWGIQKKYLPAAHLLVQLASGNAPEETPLNKNAGITFNQLQILVEFLHTLGLDPSNINEAIKHAIPLTNRPQK